MAHWASPDKVPARRLGMLKAAGEHSVPFHDGRPDRSWGDHRGAGRYTASHPRRQRTTRPHPGVHRPELPGETGDEDGGCAGTRREGDARHHRARPSPPAAADDGPGAAEPRGTGRGRRIERETVVREVHRGRYKTIGAASSPVTPDHVNPERPWPHLEELEKATEGRRIPATRTARAPSFLRARSGAVGG